MWIMLQKELRSFFNSIIGYLVIGVFLLVSALLFWMYPDSSVLEYGYADMDRFFSFAPFIFFFLNAAITMRMFSEEWRNGTLAWLFTRPLTLEQIIFGKYLASVLLVFCSILLTSVYYFSLYKLGNPEGNIDTAAVLGSYLGLLFLGAVFCSIGLFTSTLSKNQIVAFLLSSLISFFLFSGWGSLTSFLPVRWQFGFAYLGLDYHYHALGRGLIDSRDIVFFCSAIAIFLILTKFRLENLRDNGL